ncbi:heparan-alpha-glucosaminide N-acetyltransferase domain-containing protein [Nigerium massiliense]|uniref:heparan-alpha-glucosaminide N-acetyltransferase domain-containing protein n=1 Tax=Nigerium massiliense TaxID=1522317 RepID=UPI000693C39D|nr:heparan-alpha-glucosaminide N-acetyltransferase domain-containing protein [Nigerium massiliense]
MSTATQPRRALSDFDLSESDLVEVPHICEDPTELNSRARKSPRIVGIDVARGVALLGMMVVHIITDVTDEGLMPWSWRLSSGNSAALFATLAGVGIALSTGRRNPPRGRGLVAAMGSLVVRAILIGVIGLALGVVVPTDLANVILPYYAVLFVLAIPFLRVPAPLLGALSLIVAIAVPFWSHAARMTLPVVEPTNHTFASLMANPGQTFTQLMLTGVYPAVAWMSYVLAGMAIGRLNIRRWVALSLMLGGTLVALLTAGANWVLMDALGGRQALADVAARTMPLDDFTSLLVWGAGGTLPTDSLWWLGVLAPHTSTPFDLLFTLGVACGVLGACMMIGVVMPKAVRPLALMGSMPLTMYSLHLVMVASQVWLLNFEWLGYAVQVVLLLGFAFLWSRKFQRGPLEGLVNVGAKATKSLIMGSKQR